MTSICFHTFFVVAGSRHYVKSHDHNIVSHSRDSADDLDLSSMSDFD